MNMRIDVANQTAEYQPLAPDYQHVDDFATIVGLTLSSLSAQEATTAWRAFRGAREALRAVLNSPACVTGGSLNAAGLQIENLLDAINVKMVEILDHAMCLDITSDDWRATATRTHFVFEAIADAGLADDISQAAFESVRAVIANRSPLRDQIDGCK